MAKGRPIDLLKSFDSLSRFDGRTPATKSEELKDSFKMLSEFRDGGVFVSTFSGHSEWERHSNGDEVVFAVQGSTELILFIDGREVRNSLNEGSLIVVPEDTWHRFETDGVKILTVTALPTDLHSGTTPNE